MRTVTRSAVAPAGLGTDVIGLVEGSDLELDLMLESVLEGVLITGTVRGRAAGECVRCLEAVEEAVEVGLTELYAYPDRQRGGDTEDEEVRELQDDLIDLEPALLDAVVPALPYRPLCSPDCPGLCVECGARLAEDPEHGHDTIDPRWQALAGLDLETSAGAASAGEQQHQQHH